MNFKLFDLTRDKKILRGIGIVIVLIASFIVIKDEIFWTLGSEENPSDEYSYVGEGYENEGCNVVKINLHGFLDVDIFEEGDVSSDDVIQAVENAEQSENIKAIVLDIDSSGGTALAGEEVSNALSRSTKPTIALIRSMGLSAAYWSAVGTDTIFASENSDVGSIAITISYLDSVKKNQIDGLNYNLISSGKYKDMLSSDKYLTYEERMLVEKDVQIIHNNFVKAVAEKRNLDIEKVKVLADGSSVLGQTALENGLIDRIGDMYAVKQYLKEIFGEEVVICQ